MQGRRYDIVGDNPSLFQPGDYGKYKGDWWCHAPKKRAGPCRLTGNTDINWKVIEHEDGTISVSPSINVIGIWHGHLEKGIWKEC